MYKLKLIVIAFISMVILSCTSEIKKENIKLTKYEVFPIVGQSQLNQFNPKEVVHGLLITSVPNDPVISLIKLGDLKEIKGTLSIQSNSELNDTTMFHSLKKIGDILILDKNPKMDNISFIENLDFLGGVSISQINISNLRSLQNLTTINNGFHLNKLPNLKEFNPLQLVKISGTLSLRNLNHLENTEFLKEVKNLGGSLRITENINLKSINLNLTDTLLNGFLTIYANASLTDISGLENFTHVTKEVLIADNPLITNLDFLNNLKHVGLSLVIRNNKNLKDISGLSGIEYIGKNLVVYLEEEDAQTKEFIQKLQKKVFKK